MTPTCGKSWRLSLATAGRWLLPAWLFLAGVCGALAAAPASGNRAVLPADLAAYFEAETTRLAGRCLAEVKTLADWQARRLEYRRQAAEMLGLWPAPARTDLKPVVTGVIDQPEFTVEKLHFQSLPGLYVTANLYLPKGLTRPAPTILYLCGHGPAMTNGVSCGNKVSYQHHGIWFARHGYVCLLIDTLQYGEILGRHQGTYREGSWWWNARGYTPAGVEAWNSQRALDYLASRPEVDTNRFGVTGRSGGGAYSWTVAALDDRVKVIAPVAGITDLRNHVVDGAVEGHCDCMFFVNTYRWDYPLLAALAAPRPLLLVNTDADTIFPLDGVLRTYAKLAGLYSLHNATANLGLVIAPGPHKDTQDLQIPVFRWFNRHLKGEDPPISMAAVKLFAPQQLRVFTQLPVDRLNTNIQDSFVPAAVSPGPPAGAPGRERQHAAWVAALRQQCFAGWPEIAEPASLQQVFRETRKGVTYAAYDLLTQPHVSLRVYVMSRRAARASEPFILQVHGSNRLWEARAPAAGGGPEARLAEVSGAFGLDPDPSRHPRDFLADTAGRACFWPRGLGPTAWPGDVRKLTHVRRRFLLLGQTVDGMRVWDIRRAVQALRTTAEYGHHPLWLDAEGDMAVNSLYAAAFEPGLAGVKLRRMPASHQEGPDYLNVLKVLDLPQALELVSARCRVER